MDGQNGETKVQVQVQAKEIEHIYEALDRIEKRQEAMERSLNLILPNCAVHATRLEAMDKKIAEQASAIAQKTWEGRAIGAIASLLAAIGIGKS